MFQYVIESDTGLKREINEDRVAVAKRSDGLLLAVVADGMGGHNAGDVASDMTVKSLIEQFSEEQGAELKTAEQQRSWLSEHVRRINREVFEYSEKTPGCKGMGTTLIAAMIDHGNCIMCHIGDSRAYLIGFEGLAVPLTRDHSYVNILVDSGEISQEEAETHPKKNWIVKALGTEPSIDEELIQFAIPRDSYFLICTDGLTNKVEDTEIAELVTSEMALTEKGHTLIGLANERGGEDNISFVLLSSKIEEGNP